MQMIQLIENLNNNTNTNNERDEYFKELDALFSSAAFRSNHALISHSSSDSDKNKHSSSLSRTKNFNSDCFSASNTSESSANGSGSSSSGVSLKSSSGSSIKSATSRKRAVCSKINFDHEFSDKCSVLSNSFINRQKDSMLIQQPIVEQAPKKVSDKTQTKSNKYSNVKKSSQSDRIKSNKSTENLSQKCNRNHERQTSKPLMSKNVSILKDKSNHFNHPQKPWDLNSSNSASKSSSNARKHVNKNAEDDTDLDASFSYQSKTSSPKLSAKYSKVKLSEQEKSVLTLLNTLNNQNIDKNNLLVDLLLLNLLQSSPLLNNNSRFLSDLINMKSQDRSLNRQKNRYKSHRNTNRNDDSLSRSSSLGSFNYSTDDDYREEIVEKDFDLKSTSTKIELTKKATENVQTKQVSFRPKITLPDIDDPLLFIDNVYDQIMSQKNNQNQTIEPTRELFRSDTNSTSYKEASSNHSNLSYNLYDEFSFIDLYSNKTNEINSLSDDVLQVKNRTLIDWNYEEDKTENDLDKATLISQSFDEMDEDEKKTECNCFLECTQVLSLKEETLVSIYQNRHESSNANKDNFLVMKLLNSFSHIDQSFSSNISSASKVSSVSTQYAPLRPKFKVIKNSYLFKPVEFESCGNAQTSLVACRPKSNQNTFISERVERLFKSIKHVFEMKNGLLFPLALLLFGMKFNTSQTLFSISSGSMIGLSSVLQTTSLTSAACASITGATQTSLENLIKSFLKA